MNDYQDWLWTENDRVVSLTLNRPAVMNCFAESTFRELRDITGRLGRRKEVCAVIVQGQGDHFSVGMDVSIIERMIALPEPAFRRELADLQRCLDAFEALEKPTIARIRGFCIGAGLVLALCCDFRVASQRTIFSLPEVKIGVAVVMGTQRVARVAGVAATKEMILLAERFGAPAALSWGLLHRLVAPEQLDAAAEAIAGKFRRLPPRTVGIAKRLINEGYGRSIRDSQALEIDAQVELLGSHDLGEAVASHIQKRPPAFTGE
jgi:enoyl-CoA hydratase/carnithine racemase